MKNTLLWITGRLGLVRRIEEQQEKERELDNLKSEFQYVTEKWKAEIDKRINAEQEASRLSRSNLMQQVINLRENIRLMEKHKSEDSSKVKQFEKTIEQLKSQIASLESKNRAQTDECSSKKIVLEAHIEQLQRTIEQLKSKLQPEQKREPYTTGTTDLSTLQEVVKFQDIDIIDLRKKIDVERDENAKLREAIKTLKDNIKKLDEELQYGIELRRSLRAKNKALTAKLKEAKPC